MRSTAPSSLTLPLKGGGNYGETPIQRPHPAPPADFAALVGAAGWARLSPAIRARFSAKGAAASVTYDGIMEAVRSSLAGLLLAQFCRMVGTPLAPWRGTDVPVSVRVYEAADAGGIVWERVYRFPEKAPVTVRSTKVLTPDGALLECVGGGFGMRLKVFERDGRLHFVSIRYFWQCGPWRIPLPRLLTPGAAHVIHTDEGGGLFRFTMTFQHPILGETYFQDGVFRLKE